MKHFLNSVFINNHKSKEGTPRLKFSGKLEDVVKELKANTNEKGYFNLWIQERRTPTDHSTHYLYRFEKDNEPINQTQGDKK